MWLLSLIVAFVASGALAVYVLTCSVNDAPPASVHPIVGKWRMEMFCGQPTAEGLEIVCEFLADGSYVVDNTSSRNGTQQIIGSYEINQNTISTLCPPGQTHAAAPGYTTGHKIFSNHDNMFTVNSDNSRGAEMYTRLKQ